MNATILTIEQLVKFCQENKLLSFSSSESGYKLAVKVPAVFDIEESDDTHRGMMRLKFKLFHTLLNRNGSFVSEESATEAMKTIPDRPILAAIHQLDDGTWDFEGHEMEEVENEEGQKEIRYIESQVGSFSSEPAWMEYDEEMDKTYICCYGYIPRDYTKAAEIIERKNGTKNSVELYIDEMAYNAKEKYLDLKKFYVNGSTLLGSKDDGTEIGEGMLGARADIADFSTENNSVKFEQNDKLIKAIESLQEALSSFNINDSLGKEVKEVKKKEFEQKPDNKQELEQANVFDLSDPADGENGGDGNAETGSTTEGGTTETGGTTEVGNGENQQTTGGTTEGGNTEGGETQQATGDGDPAPKIDDDETDESKKIGYTISLNNKIREFKLGVSEKLRAIYELVASTYEEADGEWYGCELFEEEGYIEMYGYFTGKNYRQAYEEKDGVFSLVGERIEIFKVFVTEEEKKSLEQMKIEFSEVKEELRKYKEEPQKMEILNSEDYSKVFKTEEYSKLMEQESHFDLSIDEVKAKADSILLDYAKHSNFSLLSENESQARFQSIPVIQKKVGRYGMLFANNTETKSE